MSFGKTIIALVAVLALASVANARCMYDDEYLGAPTPAPAPPPFCYGLECPYYEVLNTTATYEIRKYNASAWVSTKVTAPVMAMAMGMSFGRLLPYFGGMNTNGTKIPKGNPLRISAASLAPMFSPNTYEVSLYLPASVPTPLPAPIMPGIEVTEVPEFTAYVVTTPKKVIDEFSLNILLASFKANLTADGITPPSAFSIASYKAPKKGPKFDEEDFEQSFDESFDEELSKKKKKKKSKKAKKAQHNEVWLIADSADDVATAEI